MERRNRSIKIMDEMYLGLLFVSAITVFVLLYS
jgi:hypothetical protein